MATDQLIKVLIADDSEHARELLANIIQSDPRCDVIGMAENGRQAIDMTLQLQPDVVIMDLMMPELNGFEAIKEIMEKKPTRIIAVSGVFNKEEIVYAFQALSVGADAIIEKPKWISDEQYLDTSRFIIETIKALVESGSQESLVEIISNYASIPVISGNVSTSIIAIAASIGGPPALLYLLSKLPKKYPIPIVIYQQIPEKLLMGFVDWLNSASALKVQLTKNGTKLVPGSIYLIPENAQLEINETSLVTLKPFSKPETKLSINDFFKAVANAYHAQSMGILFKGLGTDGEAGIEALRQQGAVTFIQSTSHHKISLHDNLLKETKSQGHAVLDDILLLLTQLGSARR